MIFLKNIGWTTLAQIAASSAFIYTLLAARLLGVENYGIFQAAMGIFGLFSFLHLPFYFGSVHCVGRARAEDRPAVLGGLLTLALAVTIFIGLFFSLSAAAGSSLLKSPSITPWLACGALIAANTLLTLFHGTIQAEHRFRLFAFAKIAEVSLVLTGGVFFISQLGPAGAISGYTIAMLCVFGCFILRFRPTLSAAWAGKILREEWPALGRLTLVLGFLLVLEHAPAVWARSILSAEESGYFGALYNLRNTVFPFALAVTLTFYSHRLAQAEAKSLLRQALGLIAGLAVIFEITALGFSSTVVLLFYGREFLPAAAHLPLYGLALTLQMFAMLLLFSRLAENRLALGPLLLALIVFSGGLYFYGHTISGIIAAQAAGALICLAGLLIPVHKEHG